MTGDNLPSEPVPVPQLEADAIRHRMAIRQQAEDILQDGVRQVLQRLNMPGGSQLRIEADGSMVAVAPQTPI